MPRYHLLLFESMDTDPVVLGYAVCTGEVGKEEPKDLVRFFADESIIEYGIKQECTTIWYEDATSKDRKCSLEKIDDLIEALNEGGNFTELDPMHIKTFGVFDSEE